MSSAVDHLLSHNRKDSDSNTDRDTDTHTPPNQNIPLIHINNTNNPQNFILESNHSESDLDNTHNSASNPNIRLLTNNNTIEMIIRNDPNAHTNNYVNTPYEDKIHPPYKQEVDWKMFGLGIRFGCMMLLLFWLVWDCVVDARLRPYEQSLWVDSVLPLYRGVGCIILFSWYWGLMMYVWTKYKINFVFLFEIDPRSLMSYSEVFEESVVLTSAFLANFLIYFKVLRGDFPAWVPSGYFPVSMYVYFLYRILPLPPPFSSRSPSIFWRSFGQVFLAPFGRVSFLTSFMGDVLTSLIKVNIDLAYGVCFLLSADWVTDPQPDMERPETCLHNIYFRRMIVPLFSALPLWFRFMQCLRRYWDTTKRHPNLPNAGKYAIAHSVVLFGVFHSSLSDTHAMSSYKILWILSLVLSTIYTFSWDVLMDWGLGNKQFWGLRERLMFESPSFYYGAIVVDLFLRFTWTLTLIPFGENSPLPADFIYFLQPFLAVAELSRRTMWACLRLEWEHINTAATFKSISLTHSHLSAGKDPELNISVPQQLNSKDREKTGLKIVAEVGVLVLGVLFTAMIAAMTAN